MQLPVALPATPAPNRLVLHMVIWMKTLKPDLESCADSVMLLLILTTSLNLMLVCGFVGSRLGIVVFAFTLN